MTPENKALLLEAWSNIWVLLRLNQDDQQLYPRWYADFICHLFDDCISDGVGRFTVDHDELTNFIDNVVEDWFEIANLTAGACPTLSLLGRVLRCKFYNKQVRYMTQYEKLAVFKVVQKYRRQLMQYIKLKIEELPDEQN